MLSRQEIHAINRHTEPYSCLFIGQSGLFRVHCPFTVKCTTSIGHYKAGQELTVEKVKLNLQAVILYVIDKKGYLHSYFVLIRP